MKKLCLECQRILGPGFSQCACGWWPGDLSCGLSEPRVPVALKVPYVSIDIETTGLNPETCQILEFGAVYDDGQQPIDTLPVFRRIVQRDYMRGTPFALALNANLLKSMSSIRNEPRVVLIEAIKAWTAKYGFTTDDYERNTRILDTTLALGRWYGVPNKLLKSELKCSDRVFRAISNPPTEICFCRNDELIPLFASWLKRVGMEPNHILAAGKNFASFDLQFIKKLPGIEQINFKHRCIDPAMLYWQPDMDDAPPCTATCLKRAGLNTDIAHTAVEDAKAVIHLVRRAVTCPNIRS